MTTIAILEGFDDYSNDVDMLGWGFKSAWKATKRITNKVTRPVRKLTRPITRPLDRVLKKIPLVRTAYRASIATTYLATGQVHKVWGATKRTGKSLVKDFVGAKKFFVKLAIKVLTPLAKSGVSKVVAKVMAMPTLTALALKSPYAYAAPMMPVAVNEAINIVWKGIKKVVKKVIIKPAANLLKNLARNIGGRGPASQKMTDIPSPSGGMGFPMPNYGPPQMPVAPKKKGGGAMIGLLALAPLALMMG